MNPSHCEPAMGMSDRSIRVDELWSWPFAVVVIR